MTRGSRLAGLVALLPLVLAAACGGGGGGGAQQPTASRLTLYTCASDTTVQPVIDAFEKQHPGSRVSLYRAPTGELNARIAGDVRSGGLKADVLWACDPLTMQHYVKQGLVGGWTPKTDIPAQVRTPDYVGVAMLYMLAVAHNGVPAPKSWQDLTSPAYAGKVAVPDPSLAASALGALGYFSQAPGYGVDFYAKLKQNGAVQVGTPDDVVTGVAQGRYHAGITIANSAYAAKATGSPIQISWPKPGAVAIYGPVALARKTGNRDLAKAFLTYVTSKAGQELIGKSGSYPTLPGVTTPPMPAGAPVVTPDWHALGATGDQLLSQYQQVFGG